ncbi:ankyrin-3-like [Leptopilina boulardi]|uniref:ankyrin-3-like n=1 Tax=Leptopilina boulardi TaxID=63433 RepID=UPI0021F600FA|nr:ankyrin-3-like [Leptopilina boulardi]XP_051169032.1 ankyrin-3-like [Leptopilina boulardi]XP_051169033.1 ankyrin-3-like [Leptopilina boulardi]
MAFVVKSSSTISNNVMRSFKQAVKQNNLLRINEIASSGTVQQADKYGDSFLHIIAKEGSPEAALILCQLRADIYLWNKQKQSPLFYALQNSVDMVKVLLNHSRINDWNLLRQALIFGSEEVVRLIVNRLPLNFNNLFSTAAILNNNFKYGEVCEFKNTEEVVKALLQLQKYSKPEFLDYPLLILFAAKILNKNILQIILEDCEKYLEENSCYVRPLFNRQGSNETIERFFPIEISYRGRYSETALHYAVCLQYEEAAKFLLNEGADPNCKTRDELTPLHYASYFGNEEICRLLLAFGAESNPNSCYSNDPMHFLCSQRCILNFESHFITNSHRPSNPLHLVCGDSDARHVLNSSLKYFISEMHELCYVPDTIFHTNILSLLLENGANPFIQGKFNYNPFFSVCENGRLREMAIFLEYLPICEIPEYRGNTALHIAVMNNDLDMIDLLVKKGHSMETKNSLGHTPLMSAVWMEKQPSLQTIEKLVYHGADLHAISFEGWTVLQMSACFNKPEVVLKLLELGSDDLWKLPKSSELQRVSNTWSTVGRGLQVLIAIIALKYNELGDYVNNYIKPSDHDKALNFFAESKLEVVTLKKTMIFKDRHFSYYDFLTGNFSTVIRIIRNVKSTNELISISNMSAKFPCYAYLIRRRFLQIENLGDSVDHITDFLTNLSETKPLPVLVVNEIFGYLSYSNIQVFGDALSKI